jgi:hypothetical protein
MMLFSLAFACTGCLSCQPSIPSTNVDSLSDTNQDTAEDTAEDTADTGGIEAPCPIMEIEPNNNYDEAQFVILENWICGDANEEFDLDNYGFTFPEEDGWIKVWGRGQDIGSTADLILTLDQDINTAISVAQIGTTDPLIIAPVTNEDALYATIYDQYGGVGDQNFYELMISQVKAPVEYNQVEDDEFGENNGPAGAIEVSNGTRIFGQTSTNSDTDWYRISIPEGQTTNLVLSIEAFAYGSPLDSIIYLYPPEVFESSETPYTAVRNNAYGSATNLDPTLRHTVDNGGEWAVLVKSNLTGGSDFHWYVLDIQLEEVVE